MEENILVFGREVNSKVLEFIILLIMLWELENG